MTYHAPTFGFPVQILGRSGIKSHDTRRWASNPHLRVSLRYLHQVFEYLAETGIRMYRLASGLAPYATHPDLPQFRNQVEECAQDLSELGKMASKLDLRLSFHPGQFVVINSPDEDLAQRSSADIEVQASILEAMGLDDHAVVVLHVGGVYGNRTSALDRFAKRFEMLSPMAQRRIALENDDARFDVTDILKLHERLGLRLIFDAHHHFCYNPNELSLQEAAKACLDTWRGRNGRAKVHFSSPRTDWGFRYGSDGRARNPNWTSHAEFIDPFAFIAFYRRLVRHAPDVMLEAKAKDVAVLQLQRDLLRYAPDLAAIFDLNHHRHPLREIS